MFDDFLIVARGIVFEEPSQESIYEPVSRDQESLENDLWLRAMLERDVNGDSGRDEVSGYSPSHSSLVEPTSTSPFSLQSAFEAAPRDQESLEHALWIRETVDLNLGGSHNEGCGEKLSVAGSSSPSTGFLSYYSFSTSSSQPSIDSPLIRSTPHSFSDYMQTSNNYMADISQSLEHDPWAQESSYLDGTSGRDEKSRDVPGNISHSAYFLSYGPFSPFSQLDIDSPPLAHSTPFFVVDYEEEDLNRSLEHEIRIGDEIHGNELPDLVAGSISPSSHNSLPPLTQSEIFSPHLSDSTPDTLSHYVQELDRNMRELGIARAQEIWFGCCDSHRETGVPGLGIQIYGQPLFPAGVVGLGFMLDEEVLFDDGPRHVHSY